MVLINDGLELLDLRLGSVVVPRLGSRSMPT